MICNKCKKKIRETIVQRVLADREAAIKRMNKRSKNATKKERN
jgi:hypothetical protein